MIPAPGPDGQPLGFEYVGSKQLPPATLTAKGKYVRWVEASEDIESPFWNNKLVWKITFSALNSQLEDWKYSRFKGGERK